ncbi:hypothetical protein V8C35DRAFT_101231 [Trichoderma chlorosporum]
MATQCTPYKARPLRQPSQILEVPATALSPSGTHCIIWQIETGRLCNCHVSATGSVEVCTVAYSKITARMDSYQGPAAVHLVNVVCRRRCRDPKLQRFLRANKRGDEAEERMGLHLNWCHAALLSYFLFSCLSVSSCRAATWTDGEPRLYQHSTVQHSTAQYSTGDSKRFCESHDMYMYTYQDMRVPVPTVLVQYSVTGDWHILGSLRVCSGLRTSQDE